MRDRHTDKKTCPCCGYLIFDEPPGSYEICPICFWEDDEVQLRFPALEGGANDPSLIQAQKNFVEFGACEKRFQKNVRKPKGTDVKDSEWRVVDDSLDKIEEPFTGDGRFTSYPEDFTTLY